MWTCPKCQESHKNSFDVCWNCGTTKDGVEDPDFASQGEPDPVALAAMVREIPEGMLLVTTPSLDRYSVDRYLGVVCGEAIIGANVFRDALASITDVVGGRSQAYESALAYARQNALAEMAQRARNLGGNAVLSIDVDYETLRGSMMMVACSGTAVVVIGPDAGVEIAKDSATA